MAGDELIGQRTDSRSTSEYAMRKTVSFYREAYGFLQNMLPGCLSMEDVERLYLTVDESAVENLNGVDGLFYRLIGSAQNAQRMSSAIGLAQKNHDIIADILHGFDAHIVSTMNARDLYEQFYESIGFTNRESPRNLWRRWTCAVVDSARFLEAFGNRDAFFGFCDRFVRPQGVPEDIAPYVQASLPLIIRQNISGMGFALACDFLKELGFSCYPKPDVHLKDVFSALGFVSSKDDLSVYTAIVKAATDIDAALNESVTPYKLDKIIWLICSGKFYEVGDWRGEFVGRRKDAFIAHMKPLMSID